MPDEIEVRTRVALSRLPNTKLTYEQQEQLAALELKHGNAAAEAFSLLVARELESVGLDSAVAFAYEARRVWAEKLADVKMPDPDLIVPEKYARLLHACENNLIEANAIAREARKRADDLAGLLDNLEQVWRERTIETVEWKADAAGSPLLFRLRQEVVAAKSHARLCESCHETVKSKLFALNWMMQNWDRLHGRPNTKQEDTRNEFPSTDGPVSL